MRSNFSQTAKSTSRVGSQPRIDEVYDLRGLNLTDPDQVMSQAESPFLTNSRMYAREQDETRVAQRTRKGSRRLSTPVGEAINVQNIAAGTGDASFTASTWILQPFIPISSGALTKLEVEIKTLISGSGHVIVEIYTDVAGVPGVSVAQGAILGGDISTTYTYKPIYFIDAPSLVTATQCWMRFKVQEGGTATYSITKTAATGGKSTVTPGTILTDLGYTWRYKSYLSTVGIIKGFTRRYPSNNVKRTLFALGTNMYATTDAGVVTSISSAIHASSTKVRFDQYEDNTMWVDGFGTAKKWDGTTVTDVAGAPTAPTHFIMHQNRGFFIPAADPTRVDFTELGNLESRRSVDFFYVPSPKSPDRIAGWCVFQDNLVILTHETKHIVYGSDIGSFTRKQAIGTKGAVSQEAIAVDRNYIYFMADDKHIYRYNGVEDEILSENIEPLLQSIQDTSKVRLHLFRNQLRVYYPSDSDIQSEDMLLIELTRKESNKYLQWFHDTGRLVTGSLEWYLDNNQLIEFSSRVGAFYLGETDESDLGKAIDFKYWTAYKAYGSGAAKDRIKRFRPFVRPSDAPYVLRVGKDIDFQNKPSMVNYLVDGEGATWGSFVWGDGTLWGSSSKLIDSKVAMSGRGKFTQYRFECNRVDSPVELLGYVAMVKSGRVR